MLLSNLAAQQTRRTAVQKKLVIRGARVLTPHGFVDDMDVLTEDGRIAANGWGKKDALELDARGLWLLPGLVDLHGDAFERVLSPRPGVQFPLEMALRDHERMLLASGITTFFYSIADSYEPGVRGRETARLLVRRIKSPADLCVNSYVHLRHEESQTKGMDELMDWVENRQVDLLSLNDHLPDLDNDGHFVRYLKSLRLRASMPDDEARQMIRDAVSRRDEGHRQCIELARLAREVGIPLASHDDDAKRIRLSEERKVDLVEFPVDAATARRAKNLGMAVLMGAPNAVHGGSHLGWLSVRDAVRNRTVDLLCSDYHYPSLMAAPFLLARDNLLPMEEAWDMVSAKPAALAGLGDRKGLISEDFDADLVLVEVADGGIIKTRMVLVEGRLAGVFLD